MTDRTASRRKWLRIDATGAAICLAMTAAVWLLTIQPLLDMESTRLEQEQELEAHRREARRLDATLDTLSAQLDQIGRAVNANRIELIPATRMNQRVSELTELAARVGLRLDEIQPGAPRDGPGFQRVSIVLVGAGDYAQCVRFMHDLHRVFPDMAVAGFDLAGEPRTPGSPAQFNLTLTWYAAESTATAALDY